MSKQKAHTWIKDNREYIFIGGCFIFFIFTMLYNLMHSALWGDEWIEYLISQTEIRTGKFYRDVISTFQPPLYNFLMHFWLKMDNSVLWFRSFNVVIGFLSGVCLFGTVNRLTNKYVAGVSVCVLATAYEWVYCIQECSEYALMLFCLFVAVYAYVEVCEKFAYWKMVILILGCVGAVYSQYGSAFVVIPLLGFFYLHNMFSEESCRSRKIVINVSYVISLIIFAIPLYTFFMSKQMENNQIAGHILPFSIECCKEILIKLGQIIGYFFQQTTGVWAWFWSAFGIALIIISVVLVFKKTINWTRLSLIFSMWFAYILHYFLVQLHIYAMAHANQSSGFFCRYSYFYIPLLCVVIPVCCYEIFKVASKSMKTLMVALGTVGAICMCVSLHSLLGNWHKSLDDVYA